jgi:2-methylisocitrate lyase-like PEP mutase family enzyme
MGKKFRTLLKEKRFITSMGIDTPVHAKSVEKAGFDYAYLGGYDVSLTLLGLPDMGLITETEMVAAARNVAHAVEIPVVCDADTGYGNAINVMRTCRISRPPASRRSISRTRSVRSVAGTSPAK